MGWMKFSDATVSVYRACDVMIRLSELMAGAG
jgi:hypothetical protein